MSDCVQAQDLTRTTLVHQVGKGIAAEAPPAPWTAPALFIGSKPYLGKGCVGIKPRLEDHENDRSAAPMTLMMIHWHLCQPYRQNSVNA